MRSLKLVLICLAAAAAFAGTAQAAQRYAAPGANGPEPCKQGAPCSLEQAVNKAPEGSEIIVGPGTYNVTKTLAAEGGASNYYVHGDFSGPMPQIVSSSFVALSPTTTNDRVAYLDVTATGPSRTGISCYSGGLVERVRVTVTGDSATGIGAGADCKVRDSLTVVSGMNSVALSANGSFGTTYTPLTRNVTAIAVGPGSRGLVASCAACITGTTVLDVKNTIAEGAAADLETGSGGKAVVSNSNFDTSKSSAPGSITDAGGNQLSPPLFVNAAAGDYREAAGSPTIDAGAVDPAIGTLDLAGNPRVQGATVDIGAYEFEPPPPPPAPVGVLQSLQISPATFRAVNAGEAIFSAKKGAKKPAAPIGTTVTYAVSAKAQTEFFVEKKVVGRKVKGNCKTRVTKANRKKKRCVVYRLNKSGFAHSGNAGENTFKFSGRLGGAGLQPGAYRLVGTTGAVSKSADFKIVK
jgi:hypothetical protein